MGKPAALVKQNCPKRTLPREVECEEEILVASSKGQNNNPAACATGLPVVCWDWLKARRPYTNHNFAQDLKTHALSLSHLTYTTTIRILHIFGSPSFPV